MNGYDAFLARELEDYERRGDDADHLNELVAERAIELCNDAERFLAWIGERGLLLSEILVTSSNTGRSINARTALVANAPVWLRELILDAELIDDDLLEELKVEMSNGKTLPADQLLIATAPEWLREELVDWLSKQSQLEDEVEAGIADDKRLCEEDAAAERYWEAA